MSQAARRADEVSYVYVEDALMPRSRLREGLHAEYRYQREPTWPALLRADQPLGLMQRSVPWLARGPGVFGRIGLARPEHFVCELFVAVLAQFQHAAEQRLEGIAAMRRLVFWRTNARTSRSEPRGLSMRRRPVCRSSSLVGDPSTVQGYENRQRSRYRSDIAFTFSHSSATRSCRSSTVNCSRRITRLTVTTPLWGNC